MLYRIRYIIRMFQRVPDMTLRHAWYCSGCSESHGNPIEDADDEISYMAQDCG